MRDLGIAQRIEVKIGERDWRKGGDRNYSFFYSSY